jgi:site-specific DNA-cytosine methylase
MKRNKKLTVIDFFGGAGGFEGGGNPGGIV